MTFLVQGDDKQTSHMFPQTETLVQAQGGNNALFPSLDKQEEGPLVDNINMHKHHGPSSSPLDPFSPVFSSHIESDLQAGVSQP